MSDQVMGSVSQPVPVDQLQALPIPPAQATTESSATEKDSKGKQRRVWSAEEDERLRLLVSYWGDQCGKNGHWDKISAHFEHRSNKDCRKRWFHSLDPKLKRGRWTEQEDKVLVEAYTKMGPVWHRIAQLIPGRTDDQCSKRYNDVLDPNISTRLRSWTPDEDQLLLNLVAKMGTKWRKIANEMDGRTGLTCRNRWRKIMTPSKESRGSGTIVPQAESSATAALGSGSTATSDGSGSGSGSMIPPLAPLSTMVPKDEPINSPMSIASGSIDSPESSLSTLSKRSPIALNSSASSSSSNGNGTALSTAATVSALHKSKQAQPIPPPMEPADSTTTTTHYTFSVDPEYKEHHSLTPRELEELVQIAKKNGQSITVHQHNYHHHHYYGQTNSGTNARSSVGSTGGPTVQQNTSAAASSANSAPPVSQFLPKVSTLQPQQQQQQQQQQQTQPSKTQKPSQLQPQTSTSQSTPQSRSQTPISASTPNFLNIDLMGLNENVIPEFDEELALDFEAFDGIPFNPS